ncbi:MAG TPA: class I SAM-dependent methyltransferase, partial [Gaiellales bacterium]|nr:class I SAM-dependent methyltransferase [Gaiellales bacterium]
DQTCVLCGHAGMVVVLPGNAVGALEVEEFACTSDRLNEHDDILRCPRCGMVSARATVSRHELVEQYEQTRDDAYLAELEARRELFGWVLDRVDAYALPGRRLFEAGSNMGVFLSVAGDRGWAARGVEPSRWAVDRGRELFGVELVQGTAEDAGEAPASADVVVLLDVLEHLADPVAGLAALRRIVADEGLVVLTTINVESLHARLRGGSWPWYIRPHVHYFTPETLSTTMRRAGFSLVEYTVVPRWFHLSYVAERGASNLGLASRLAGRMAGVWDPRLPVGLLGDVVLAIGRPVAAGSPE